MICLVHGCPNESSVLGLCELHAEVAFPEDPTDLWAYQKAKAARYEEKRAERLQMDQAVLAEVLRLAHQEPELVEDDT